MIPKMKKRRDVFLLAIVNDISLSDMTPGHLVLAWDNGQYIEKMGYCQCGLLGSLF